MPAFRFLRSHHGATAADAAVDAAFNVAASEAAQSSTTSSSAAALISSRSYEPEQLISVPLPLLILSTTPLFLIAYISWRHKLELASPVVVSTFRTFIQLSILGFILDPIFAWGIDYWLIVIAYVLFMVTLASREAANRTKYVFKGMGPTILGVLLINVSVVGMWAFGIIIKPTPIFNPQYVIPIVGMLLGNSINGVALSLNSILTSLVESQREVELYLSFGATGFEASASQVRKAIRAGTTPVINSMAVIGLISIPGMMTGQILGGAPVIDAARYQMLIMYLIATCVFGSTLMLLYVAVSVGFDKTHMLRTDRIQKRTKGASLFDCISETWRMVFCCCCDQAMETDGTTLGKKKPAAFTEAGQETEALTSQHKPMSRSSSTHSYRSMENSLEILTIHHSHSAEPDSNANHHGHDHQHNHSFAEGDGSSHALKLKGIKRSVPIDERNQGADAPRRVLFSDLNLTLANGEIAAVKGPSGAGKSQLLRVIAGLSPAEEGELGLGSTGIDRRPGTDWTQWRREVRYVTQFKVDIPGTPHDFAKEVASFKSHRAKRDAPMLEEMLAIAGDFLEQWELSRTSLDKEWTFLSGGESQRVILALAMASRPSVILLDESTSALDMETKLQVERSVKNFAWKADVGVLLVTHDKDQLDRFGEH